MQYFINKVVGERMREREKQVHCALSLKVVYSFLISYFIYLFNIKYCIL